MNDKKQPLPTITIYKSLPIIINHNHSQIQQFKYMLLARLTGIIAHQKHALTLIKSCHLLFCVMAAIRFRPNQRVSSPTENPSV